MPIVQAAGSAPPIQAAIREAAYRTNTDFDYLLAQAKVESGLDAGARAKTSSAAGLFQFIGQTWLETVRRHGDKHGLGWAAGAIEYVGGRATIRDPGLRQQIMQLRFDPETASLMAGEYARDNSAHLEAAIGKTPDHVQLYLAHFLGPAGAEKFIRASQADPAQAAAPLFADAAAANRPIFFDKGRARSLDEVRGLFAAKLERAGGEAYTPNGTAPDRPAGWEWPVNRSSSSIAPLEPVRHPPMTQVLSTTFGIGSPAGDRASSQVAAAYAKFASFGL